MNNGLGTSRHPRAAFLAVSLCATFYSVPGVANTDASTVVDASKAFMATEPISPSDASDGAQDPLPIVVMPDSETIADMSRRVGRRRVRATGTFGLRELRGVSFGNSGVLGTPHRKDPGACDSIVHLAWSEIDAIAVRYSSALTGMETGAVIGGTPGAMLLKAGSLENADGEIFGAPVGGILILCGAVLMVAGGAAGGVVGAAAGSWIANWKTLYIAPSVHVVAGGQGPPRVIATIRHRERNTRWDDALRKAVERELKCLGYGVVRSDTVRKVLRAALGNKEAKRAERSEPSSEVLRLIREHNAADAVLLLDVRDSASSGRFCSIRLLGAPDGEELMTAEVFVPSHRKGNPAQVARCITTGALMHLRARP